MHLQPSSITMGVPVLLNGSACLCLTEPTPDCCLPITESLSLQLERCLCVLVEIRREKLGNNLFCFLFSLFPNRLSRKLPSLPLWLLFSYQNTKRSSTSVKRSMLRGHLCPYTFSIVCSDVKNSFYIDTRTLIFCLPFHYCRTFHVVVLAPLHFLSSPLFGCFNRWLMKNSI